MSELLFLSHRIPFPPDKGDKIRSYNVLKGLARLYTVHLGTFIDDQRDWQFVQEVQALCGETCIRPLVPARARLRSGLALLKGEALTLEYYRDATLGRWVRDLLARRPIDRAYVYSSSMAQYVLGACATRPLVRLHDPCDVDSDKWLQYSRSRAGLMRWIYGREARTLAAAERYYTGQYDATTVVSPVEAEILGKIAPEYRSSIHVVTNGVDTEYFDPAMDTRSPFAANAKAMVFTGAMDYHPNVDAVQWFADEVLPPVRAQIPEAVFYIVGSNPTPEVRALANRPAIHVAGRVPDVRPYLAHARVVLAPLRIARGVQNKVLEAMAMARPVVATRNAVQGIAQTEQSGAAIEDDPARFAAAITRVLRSDDRAVPEARAFVTRRFSWDASVRRIAQLLEVPGPAVEMSGATPLEPDAGVTR